MEGTQFNSDTTTATINTTKNNQSYEQIFLKYIKGETHDCNICNETFAHKSELIQHVQIHARKGSKCVICNKEFSTKYYLSHHMKIHAGVKEFHCTQCNKIFSRIENLSRHMKSHEGDYKCPLCGMLFGYSFKYKDEFHLNKHMKEHREENSNLINNINTNIQKILHTDIVSPGTQLQPGNKVIIVSLENSNTTLSEKIVQKQTENTETEHSTKDIYITNEPHETYLSHSEVKMEDENEITIKEEVIFQSNKDRQIYESLLQETSQENGCTIWKDSSSNEKTLQNMLCCPVCSKTFTTEHDLRFHVNKHEELNFDSNSSSSTAHQTETTQYGKIKTELDVACTRNQLQTDNGVLSPRNSNTTLSENTETDYNFKDIYVKNEPCEEYLSHCEGKMEDEKEITIKEEFIVQSNQGRQIYEFLLQETSQEND